MKTGYIVLALGLLATTTAAWAQTDGQSKDAFGSPDIYKTGKTGSTTLPPENAKSGGNAPEENSVKKALQEMYDRCVTATKKRDESVMAGLRTRDFTYKDAKGKSHTGAEVETNERQTLTAMTTIDSVSTQVDSVKLSGAKATATVRQSFAGTLNDAQSKPHKMTWTATTRDVWVQSANGWKIQSVQAVTLQETRDGKPYDPTAAQNDSRKQNSGNSRANGNYGSGYRQPGYHAPRITTPKLPSTGRGVKRY